MQVSWWRGGGGSGLCRCAGAALACVGDSVRDVKSIREQRRYEGGVACSVGGGGVQVL